MIQWLLRNKTKLLILYAIKVALFIPLYAQAATTTVSIDIEDVNSVTSRYRFPDIPNTSTTTVEYSLGKETGAGYNDFSGGGSGGGMDLSFWVTYDSSKRVQPNFSNPLTVGSYKGYIRTSTDTYLISAFEWDGTEFSGSIPPLPICDYDPSTRIIEFLPEEATTTNNPVSFSLDACIDPDDVGTIKGINLTFHNIDQNVLLTGALTNLLSPDDIYLIKDMNVATTGLYSFSTSTISLEDGNYRIEACIERGYLFGIFSNPFSSISDCQSHQFIVGTSTFIGNITQRTWGETNDFLEGLTATSSAALAATCNPISGSFGIRECLSFLFIPDSQSLTDTMNDARGGILTRVPWGYLTRFVSILSSPATTTIPSFTASVQIGPGDDMTPEVTTITIDPADMLAGGATLLESIRDPINNKSPRDIFYTMVQLTVALGVLLTIVADLMKSHETANSGENRNGKLS